MAKRKKWVGGYIRETKSGRRVYVVERWHHGTRVHFSTGCSTKEAAERELAKWELDPIRYIKGGGLADDALELDSDKVLEYRAHQLRNGLTQEWADEVARCLADWREALAGRDLRTLNLHRDLKVALSQWPTQQPHRIKALKGFFRWLREEKGLVDRSQDATLDLKVPRSAPEKQRRRKVVAPEDVAAVLKHLPEQSRDVLHLLTATAWHVSEVRRFMESGEITTPLSSENVIAMLVARHKSGDLTKTPIVYPEHLAAARRIKTWKTFPTRMTLARHMKIARELAGVPYFGMGQMRHSVLTWGVEAGASIDAASEFAQHRSKTTTKRFYLDLDVPTAPIPIRRLTAKGD